MEQKLQAIRTELPRVWDALSRCLEGLEEEAARCLRTVYAGLSVHDLTALPPETFLGYVQASLDARRALPYAGTLPEELFSNMSCRPGSTTNSWTAAAAGSTANWRSGSGTSP